MTRRDILQGYALNATELVPKFETLRTCDVLAPVKELIPTRPSRILDVGAGTGRDAAWFARRGHNVVAVEPVPQLRDAGRNLHQNSKIRWVDDRLPVLDRLRGDRVHYDLILVIAVWQHLPPQEHQQAIGTLSSKLLRRGRLIISLRHGPGALTRPCFPAEPDVIIGYAEAEGLRVSLRRAADSVQAGNRELGVRWTWLGFERP